MKRLALLIGLSGGIWGCTFDPLTAAGRDDAVTLPIDAGWVADSGRIDSGVADAASGPDATPVDLGVHDTGPQLDAGVPDTGVQDTGVQDTGPADTGVVKDTGPADAGPVDTGIAPDTGVVDTGVVPDAGFPDTGIVPDAGFPDTGVIPDAGSPDTGISPDAGFPQAVSNVLIPPLGNQPTVVVPAFAECTIDTSIPDISGTNCPPQIDIGHQSQVTGGAVAVWSVRNLTLEPNSALYVWGDRPLVIVVHDSALIDGYIDVSALGTESGPGIYPMNCQGRSQGGHGRDGAGGGGGGNGQLGASGGGRAGAPNLPGAGGRLRGLQWLVPLKGGCPGGDGLSAGTRARGGGGGGALQISVANTLTINGGVRATGGGGDSDGSAGSGGGSGGSILLEASLIALGVNSEFFAGGGGGGGGGGGLQGADGDIFTSNPAPGGSPNGNGGAGGQGGVRIQFPGFGAGAPNSSSGGGGGGAAGRLYLNAPNCVFGTVTNRPTVTATFGGSLGACSILP